MAAQGRIGEPEEVARAALTGGREALDSFGLVPGRPVRPMLAGTAKPIER